MKLINADELIVNMSKWCAYCKSQESYYEQQCRTCEFERAFDIVDYCKDLLPGREEVSNTGASQAWFNQGWNACLDEIERRAEWKQ